MLFIYIGRWWLGVGMGKMNGKIVVGLVGISSGDGYVMGYLVWFVVIKFDDWRFCFF